MPDSVSSQFCYEVVWHSMKWLHDLYKHIQLIFCLCSFIYFAPENSHETGPTRAVPAVEKHPKMLATLKTHVVTWPFHESSLYTNPKLSALTPLLLLIHRPKDRSQQIGANMWQWQIGLSQVLACPEGIWSHWMVWCEPALANQFCSLFGFMTSCITPCCPQGLCKRDQV